MADRGWIRLNSCYGANVHQECVSALDLEAESRKSSITKLRAQISKSPLRRSPPTARRAAPQPEVREPHRPSQAPLGLPPQCDLSQAPPTVRLASPQDTSRKTPSLPAFYGNLLLSSNLSLIQADDFALGFFVAPLHLHASLRFCSHALRCHRTTGGRCNSGMLLTLE